MTRLSGKFVVRFPPTLHRRLRRQAKTRGISLNRLCLEAMEQAAESNTKELPFDLPSLLKALDPIPVLGALLFGSQARKDATALSDTDLLIVLPTEIRPSRDLYSIWDTLNFDPVLSPHFVELPADVRNVGSVWLECAVDGKILFETGNQLNAFLRKLRLEIAQGLFTRKESHGQSYWIKNEK